VERMTGDAAEQPFQTRGRVYASRSLSHSKP
jgi:hypothetical protein